ncbi:hypothetical protein FGIG_05970 [Fasciola gigantica]|uniref:Uncharacterized protein n=1 Tax=Fasciola gigantica TaxID=46835 RepID=A0A504YPZ4_FASGI|nr:hypothetical protein FGIG_05970 [Fasciola gigantica]
MGVRVENLPREEEIKRNVGSSMDTNDLQVMNEDLDSYSDSSGGDKIFASVIEIQGNMVMNSSEDYKKTIANFQRELAATISGAERSEAIRQAKELELAQISLSNKILLQTCENQQIMISHLEEQLEATNNKNNKMITDLNLRMEAEESHFKDKERALAGQLNDRIEQTQLLKDCLNETQTRLSMMENERDELNLEVDRLNRELAHVTEERMKTELLMESELSDMSKLKVNHEKLVREYENLRERFEHTEQQLVSLRGGLPTIVRQAVTNAVYTMQTVATAQLERANNRLTETEERLEEQLERLRQLEFGENGREKSGLHADNPIRSHSAEHVTDTTARKPELKPRSKTKTHDAIDDEEVSGSEMLPHLDERPNQPIDELSKSYNQSALIEMDQRRLYKKLCDAILILEDGVSGMRKTRKNLPDRPSRPTKSPLSSMRSTSRDKSDSTRPRVRVPAPPWRATSRKPSENRSVIVAHSTELKDRNVQKDGRISHQTISDDERTSNSLFEGDAKDLQLKIWNAVNQLIGMLRVRREGIEAPKPDLSKRLQKLEKENQALQSMLHNLRNPECKQDPIVSSVCTRYAYTAQPLQAIPSTTCGNIHTRDSNFHRTIAALPCCASGSHLVDLESRCFHAVSEASRWKRRWQTQEEELRAQRERISVMKVSQQADMKIREHFLQSVCKLVREASHQIDRIVRKTQSYGHGYLHQPCCAPFNAMQLNTPAVDTPQPTPRLERISHRSHGRVQETNRSDRSRKVDDPGSGSVLATAHGDEARRGTHRINRSVAVGPISHSTTEEIGDLPDTNCNNNEISGPHSDIKSILCTEDPGIVTPDSPDQPAAAASVPLAFADNRALCPDLYLTGSPLSKTASIISDVQSASGVSEWQYGTEKEELDDSKLDDDQIKQMPSDGAPTEASLVASSQHVAVENANTEENLARWNAMREAARYELSRVLASVVAQARQEMVCT